MVACSVSKSRSGVDLGGNTTIAGDLTVKGALNVDNKMNFGKCQLHATTDDYGIFRVNGVNWWSCNNGNDAMICYKNLDVTGNLRANNVDILAKITEMETILKNHYDALMVLCEKHGMIDSNTGDGSNVTPTINE